MRSRLQWSRVAKCAPKTQRRNPCQCRPRNLVACPTSKMFFFCALKEQPLCVDKSAPESLILFAQKKSSNLIHHPGTQQMLIAQSFLFFFSSFLFFSLVIDHVIIAKTTLWGRSGYGNGSRSWQWLELLTQISIPRIGCESGCINPQRTATTTTTTTHDLHH